MSFVTTACGGAAGGSATPPEPRPQRDSDIHVAPGSGLVVPPPRSVDHNRSHVGPVEAIVETDERAAPQAADRPVPSHAHVRGPPWERARVERIVHEVARGMGLLDLQPAMARESG